MRRTATIERSHRINEQIRAPKLRVITEDGDQLGILTRDAALERAREEGLDLVEVAPNSDPPVCRILDYGKFKYQQNKRSKHKGSHHGKNKEIRLRPKTGEHDLDFKLGKARQFLAHRDKVLFSVVFRGRENAHPEEGFNLVKKVISKLSDVASVEQGPSMQGRRIVLILSPK